MPDPTNDLIYYAGIGSRDARFNYTLMGLMEDIGSVLAFTGWNLRSGGATGSDTAFEDGYNRASAWPSFNGGTKDIIYKEAVADWALDMAPRFVPGFDTRSTVAKALLARNLMQVLGRDGNSPVKVVVCWTPEGKVVGGTASALRCAKHHGIPIFNLGDKQHANRSLRSIIDILLRIP